jgi:CBS domain-containing protein
MTNSTMMETQTDIILCARTAADLMTPNPVSIRDIATVREAVALLTDKGYSAAPVIDEAGRPVGVLSHSDIIAHDRETVEHLAPNPEFYDPSELRTRAGEKLRKGYQVEKVDQCLVCDLMTPAVFSVAPEAPAFQVVEQMLALKVHRLFVVDHDGVLVGVISALDVLRHLSPDTVL